MRTQSHLIVLALTVVLLSSPPSGNDSYTTRQLKVTGEILSQKYCRDSEKNFNIIFRLRLHFANQTKGKLIVDKRIGADENDPIIARDEKSYSDGKYEYQVIVDRDHFCELDTRTVTADPAKEGIFNQDANALKETCDSMILKSDKPTSEFVILGPGEETQTETEVRLDMVGTLHESDKTLGAVRSGDHVMILWLRALNYFTKPELLQKRWEQYGDLVFKGLETEPIRIYLPTEPKFVSCEDGKVET